MRRFSLFCLTLILLIPPATAWAKAGGFESFGPFSVRTLPQGRYLVTDAIGREFHLVPRGQKPPAGVPREQVVFIPVKRVAMSGGQDVSLLITLHAMDTLVALTGGRPEDWVLEPVRKGLDQGRIVSLGGNHAIDYEQLATIKPEVFFTWDESLIPTAAALQVPVVITYGELARNLETQIKFVRFLAPFFGREKEADQYVARVRAAIARVRERAKGVKHRPKVIWGDIYEKRVLVEPGHSWAAEIVRLAGGDYLFDDVRGTS